MPKPASGVAGRAHRRPPAHLRDLLPAELVGAGQHAVRVAGERQQPRLARRGHGAAQVRHGVLGGVQRDEDRRQRRAGALCRRLGHPAARQAEGGD